MDPLLDPKTLVGQTSASFDNINGSTSKDLYISHWKKKKKTSCGIQQQ